MKKKITVLMSVYNTREEWLRDAIDSILAQTYDNIEFLIIVDCPTDNSYDIVKEYASRDNRIRILNNEKNIGLTASLNRGIKCATGEYIARMDSDDIAIPQRLEKEFFYLNNNHLDIIGSRIVRIDENSNVIGKPTQKYSEKSINEVLKYTDCIPHPTWFAKKDVFAGLNGYRDIQYCEDYDFLLRAVKHGFKIGMCDEVLLKYRINTVGITRSNSLRQFLTSNYLRKHNNRIDSITQDEIDNSIVNKLTKKASVKFEKSISYFRKGIESIKRKNLIYGITSIIIGLFESPYSLINLWNILNVQRIIKKD